MITTLSLVTFVPFVLAFLMAFPALRGRLKQTGMTWGLTAVVTLLFIYFLLYLPAVQNGEVFNLTVPWVPALGLHFSIYLDGLSLFFALIVTGVGIAVTLYTGYYFDTLEEIGRFYTLLMAFMGAMLSLVLAGNIITLFIAWELTSIISFLLISFKGGKAGEKYAEEARAARQGATRALVVTGGGGLALITGLVLMGRASGSFELANILANTSLRDHVWYEGFTILIMLAAFTKSAQFPFHWWLPGGMSAPSPASAYLHSATMVKAGIYLLARLYPVLGDHSDLWMHTVMGVGLTTMFIGAFFALTKRDLKALLAYSTVSKLGALVALIGLPDAHGIKAMVVGVLAHALYKGTMFLSAGIIEHSTGTRIIDQLGALRQKMPVMAWTVVAVGLSMAGVPPLIGYLAKETMLDAALPFDMINWLPFAVVFVASVLTVAVALIFVWDVFFRPQIQDDIPDAHFHAPSWGLMAGPVGMAILSVLFGLTLPLTVEPLVGMIYKKEFHLYLFPPDGLANPAFQASLAVLILGPLVFLARNIWLRFPRLIPLPTGVGVYEAIMRGVYSLSDWLLKSQNGSVRYYLVVIMGGVLAFILYAEFRIGNVLQLEFVQLEFTNPTIDLLRTFLLLVALSGTLASIVFKKHLMAALSLGMSGYAVGGIFLLEPAPDVALVQMLVETLGTVLIIIMIARISTRLRQEAIDRVWQTSNAGIIRDVSISLAVGLSVGLFALSAVVNRPESSEISPPIARWHITHAYPETEATDVVAAILADFRGMDTMIEILVFSVAGLGVLTLLTLPESGELIRLPSLEKVRRVIDNVSEEVDDEIRSMQEQRARSRLSNPLTRLTARIVLPFALLTSISNILYGGGSPGDGFTAGVISGLAVALWYVVFGYFEARQRLQWLIPGRLIVLGLSLAWINAIFPMLLGDAFLQIQILEGIDAPAGLHFVSTLLFETAIFLTVFGSVSLIMEAIAHPREVERFGR